VATPRTGRRPGRPLGSTNKAKANVEDIIARGRKIEIGKLSARRRNSMTPLDTLLYAMRTALATGAIKTAAGFARDAAPYLHARKSPEEGDKQPVTILVKVSGPDRPK
jgi:hypothetical protein